MTSHTPRRESGFTLVELLIVVLIIGILATIAIPVFNGQRNKAKNSAAQSAVRNALSAAKAFAATGDTYSGFNTSPNTLNSQESSLTGVSTLATAAATPGSGATPTNVLVTNFAATPVSVGAAPSATAVVLCSVSKGDRWYCLYASTSGTTYYKDDTGEMTNAAIGTTAPPAAGAAADWSTTGW